MNIEQINQKLYHSEQMLEQSNKNLEIAYSDLSELENKSQVVSLATNLLEVYLESVSGTVSDTLEGLMKSALQVFNMGVEVNMNYVEGARGGYRLVVSQDGVEGGIESYGGGVFSLISFIMLISVIVLKEKRRFIVLDETLKEVSEVYQEPLSKFIRQVCDDFDFTILLVSHQKTLNESATKTYRVSKSKSETILSLQNG